MSQERNCTLRCVWVPAHIGVNAPLTAVWVRTAPAPSNQDPEALSPEGDSWASAA